MDVRVEHGDCRDVVRTLADESIDACVTDPPYSLQTINKRFAKVGRDDKTWSSSGPHQRTARGFMNQKWDTGETAFDPAFWAEVLRVLKPGGHLVAFGGTRTYHRLASAIEDAGFEIRDQIGWLFGSGFPKSHDVAKGIDRAAGAEREIVGRSGRHVSGKPSQRIAGLSGSSTFAETVGMGMYETAPATDAAHQWEGWGTALKPAWEPICLARKPPIGTVAANVMAHGTGALNIDACRVSSEGESLDGGKTRPDYVGCNDGWRRPFQEDVARMAARAEIEQAKVARAETLGRWPANVIHDGSEEVLEAFPFSAGAQGTVTGLEPSHESRHHLAGLAGRHPPREPRGDAGSAARFFYSSKADADDRLGSKHPTVKPVDLMAYLCRLVTPPKGLVLDPFAGSGTTGMACLREGFRAILIEREDAYVADIRRRLAHVGGLDAPLFAGAAP